MDELYLKLEGIDTKEAASKFLRREVWIKEEEIQTAYRRKIIPSVGLVTR